jgi:hypothetical protein
MGYPGGWLTSSFDAQEINSPQSQKLAVGSLVNKYVKAATAKTIHPVMLLILLNFFIGFILKLLIYI